MNTVLIVLQLLLSVAILGKLKKIHRQIMAINDQVNEILADVQDETTVIGGVVTLLTTLSGMITAAGADPTKLAQIKTIIDANKKALADAVVANTPAAPPPPPTP